jgi:hypothetical protein
MASPTTPAEEQIMSTHQPFVGPLRRGVARIGRTGVKLHPVVEVNSSRADGSVIKYMDFCCSCSGTNNGHAHNKAQVFWGATNANCRS